MKNSSHLDSKIKATAYFNQYIKNNKNVKGRLKESVDKLIKFSFSILTKAYTDLNRVRNPSYFKNFIIVYFHLLFWAGESQGHMSF